MTPDLPDDPENGVEAEIKYWIEHHGWNPEDAWDFTIVRWLNHGDLRALEYSFALGRAPRKELLIYIAKFMHGAHLPNIHWQLKCVSRPGAKKGRHHNPENDIRDINLAENVSARMTHKGLYDAAVSEVAAEFKGAIGHNPFETIRKAYDKYGKE